LDIQTEKDTEKEKDKDRDKQKAKWIEGELSDQHKKIHDKLPPLNERDPSKYKAYTQVRPPNPNPKPVQFKFG
jgi:hypothetical protein